MDLKSEKILIAGAGISGIGAAALLVPVIFKGYHFGKYMMGMKNLIRRQ